MLESAQFIDILKGLEMGKYLNFKQASEILGISRGSMYRYMAEKKLMAKMDEFGDKVLFKFEIDELNRFKEMMKKRRKKGQGLL